MLSVVGSLLTANVAAQGTAFTYQGRLNDGPSPANGSYSIRVALYDASISGAQIGGALTNEPTVVSEGLFTVTLDFGPGVFTGAARWLELGVRTNGATEFTLLAPRQPLTPAPYAIFAGRAAALEGLLPGAQLSGLYPNAVTFDNAANSFGGNGAGLTDLNASALASGTVPDARLAGNVARTNQVWLLSGNAGTTPDTHFLGTTDNQPFEIKVNGLRALRLEDNGDGSDGGTAPDGAPNVIGGSPVNFVGTGVVGATIGGGGAMDVSGQPYTNAVLSDYGTIGGGVGNRIDRASIDTTIAGGRDNDIGTNANSATIGGGLNNTIADNAAYATIAGGSANDVGTNADYGVIGGGVNNNIGINSIYGVIAGGVGNNIAADSAWAAILARIFHS